MGNICSDLLGEEEGQDIQVMNRRQVMGQQLRGTAVQLEDDDEQEN